MAHNAYQNFTKNTNILLVDHDKEVLAFMARTLQYFLYNVTTAESGSEAMSLLAGGTKYDLVLLDAYNLPDIDGVTLLRKTVGKGITTILTSNVPGNDSLAQLAIQNGAICYLEKPIAVGSLKTMWQHVMKDRMVKAGIAHGSEELQTLVAMFENSDENQAYHEEEVNGMIGCTRWTNRLHKKFVYAVFMLGQHNCYPKAILKMMNEPNLTRLQVASHLQKCRSGNWRGVRTNKSFLPIRPATNNSGVRRYGKMPIIDIPTSYSEVSQMQIGYEVHETYAPSFRGNNFGYYPFENFSPNFGVDSESMFFDSVPSTGYQLPEIDDPLSFTELLGTEPFNGSGFVQQSFPFDTDFNYQAHGSQGF